MLKGAEIIKMPPQLRGSGKGSDNRDSTRNGRAVPGNQRDRDRGSSESDYDEAVGEEKSNRFLPYITAQPSRSGRNILDNKKRLSSDPRLRSMHTDTHTNGTDRDRGRAQTDDNVRSGRQRSVSAENRINKVSNIDPRGARNALRVSTSPTLHQHRTGA